MEVMVAVNRELDYNVKDKLHHCYSEHEMRWIAKISGGIRCTQVLD